MGYYYVYSFSLEGERLTWSCPCFWKRRYTILTWNADHSEKQCHTVWVEAFPLTQTAICVKVKSMSYKHASDANTFGLLTSLHEDWLWERLQLSCGFVYDSSVFPVAACPLNLPGRQWLVFLGFAWKNHTTPGHFLSVSSLLVFRRLADSWKDMNDDI